MGEKLKKEVNIRIEVMRVNAACFICLKDTMAELHYSTLGDTKRILELLTPPFMIVCPGCQKHCDDIMGTPGAFLSKYQQLMSTIKGVADEARNQMLMLIRGGGKEKPTSTKEATTSVTSSTATSSTPTTSRSTSPVPGKKSE